MGRTDASSVQEGINSIWRGVWEREKVSDPSALFGSRLFLEGYPVMRVHIPEDVRDVLEIGGGTGRYGLAIAKDRPRSHVIVTDILEDALRIGEEAAAKIGLSNISFQIADALKLNFPDNTFDLVFSDAVIQHIPEHARVVEEMLRVLKPGGILMATFVNGWNAPHRAYKLLMQMSGRAYTYGYEKNFTPPELRRLFQQFDARIIEQDGYNFAYGVYRWRRHLMIFKYVGGALNRMTRFIDALSGHAFSRYFGFEVFVVVIKGKEDR
jgi:ubiquinone/menaquinone biosynthesis C-methylase UbiE